MRQLTVKLKERYRTVFNYHINPRKGRFTTAFNCVIERKERGGGSTTYVARVALCINVQEGKCVENKIKKKDAGRLVFRVRVNGGSSVVWEPLGLGFRSRC